MSDIRPMDSKEIKAVQDFLDFTYPSIDQSPQLTMFVTHQHRTLDLLKRFRKGAKG